jgi:hypothetical protein
MEYKSKRSVNVQVILVHVEPSYHKGNYACLFRIYDCIGTVTLVVKASSIANARNEFWKQIETITQ